jgi:hypothetical protein
MERINCKIGNLDSDFSCFNQDEIERFSSGKQKIRNVFVFRDT